MMGTEGSAQGPAAMREQSQPVVFVAALTYRRPDMLSILLEEFLALQYPASWEVRFLIVDNDNRASAQALVEGFAPRFGDATLLYVVEPEPGIPCGRNRALDEATAQGARLLAFIDDDEYPDRHWLRELVAHYEKTGAVLIGGPVRQLPAADVTTAWLAFLSRSLVARSGLMEALCARRARKGRIDMVATNNWLGDLGWIASKRLRFDQRLRSSGGEDAAFFFEAKARGGKISWCEQAFVYEHQTSERLSLRYHFKRAVAEGTVMLRIGPTPSIRMSLYQSARMLIGAGLIVVPVLGMSSFAAGTRMLGHSFGWFSGMLGTQSKLYERSDNEAKAREVDAE